MQLFNSKYCNMLEDVRWFNKAIRHVQLLLGIQSELCQNKVRLSVLSIIIHFDSVKAIFGAGLQTDMTQNLLQKCN